MTVQHSDCNDSGGPGDLWDLWKVGGGGSQGMLPGEEVIFAWCLFSTYHVQEEKT